jgi:progesterone-induced-blocking factor 1
LNRYRQYQSTTEVRLGELQSELKLRTFEFDRLQLLYEENLKSLKTIQIESEKLQKKNEVCHFSSYLFKTFSFDFK